MNWKEYIQEAIDHTDGKWSLSDIEDRINKQTAQLFMTNKSCAVVWVDEYPQKKALTVAFGGGDLNDILHYIPNMAEYAQLLGCNQVDVYGRPGWAKVLKKHNFKQTSVTMSLDV